MKLDAIAWLPAAILGLGAVFTVGIDTQRALPLRAPLDTVVPIELAGYRGIDIPISEAEQQVAGMSDFVMRVYSESGETADQIAGAFSVYVGYYEQQMQGKTIHSPKNCLPGSGWEALTSRPHVVPAPGGEVTVNRYLLQREDERALVLYWYQGRGRVEANEYRVKLDLLLDAALRSRSDEALVRIVVPVTTTEADALELGTRVAARLVPAVELALPQ